MDPVLLIAVIGTFGGAFLLKGVEHMFGKKNIEKAPKEIVAREVLAALEAAPEEPDWNDAGWVADTHRRQYDEVEQLGESTTICYCSECEEARRKERRREIERKLAAERVKRETEERARRFREKQEAKERKERRYNAYTGEKGAYIFVDYSSRKDIKEVMEDIKQAFQKAKDQGVVIK